ncbi:hypothetical protein TW95_gp1519 [Pandoravirus inopinatum]|uniref:Uncharacterized protein n=1 Tax=Pandoravirus inopinatum TaxID=1605721 RepID=A0A0B5IZD8_9VIRU|nr:hypothetical protein TW95_gp1519 [Pandoravirus inopinatum]AJF98253.1 hypothetical protein [Pandoravirus inopinatum]
MASDRCRVPFSPLCNFSILCVFFFRNRHIYSWCTFCFCRASKSLSACATPGATRTQDLPSRLKVLTRPTYRNGYGKQIPGRSADICGRAAATANAATACAYASCP